MAGLPGLRCRVCDGAGRRTRAAVVAGAGGALFFEEQIRYDDNNRVTEVIWPHGRAGGDSEAQAYAYDEIGRLTHFEQGLWDGQAITGALTAFHSWSLDELGNWREHTESTGGATLAPALDDVNAYTHWPVDFARDADGTSETLVCDYDAAKAFLAEKEEEDGSSTHYLHDGLGRLVAVEREIDGVTTRSVSYGYDSAGRGPTELAEGLAWRKDESADGRGWGQFTQAPSETRGLRQHRAPHDRTGLRPSALGLVPTDFDPNWLRPKAAGSS